MNSPSLVTTQRNDLYRLAKDTAYAEWQEVDREFQKLALRRNYLGRAVTALCGLLDEPTPIPFPPSSSEQYKRK